MVWVLRYDVPWFCYSGGAGDVVSLYLRDRLSMKFYREWDLANECEGRVSVMCFSNLLDPVKLMYSPASVGIHRDSSPSLGLIPSRV